MRIHVWKGFHSAAVNELIEMVWTDSDRNQLLILCPPSLESFDFVKFLPEGEIEWHGDFAGGPKPKVTPERLAAPPYPEAPVLGLFTSGTSSGQTKLILYSRNCVRASLAGILTFFDPGRIETLFSYPQPFYTFGLLLGNVLALEQGWKFVSGQGRYSTQFHADRLGLTGESLLTLGTPTHFQDLIKYASDAKSEIAPSYSCVIGGARVSVALWRLLRTQLKIESPSIGYGATEASPGIAHLPAGREPTEDGEVGLPVPGLELELRPFGFEFRGPSVCLAVIHHDRIEFPRKILISDELRRRNDGVLTYHGRTDLVLNRGGEKFSLESIELVLVSKMGTEIMAFSVPDPRLGQELGLLITGLVDINAVVQTLREHFAVNFSPLFFRQVPRIPLNSNFKPDRHAGITFI